MRHFFPALPQPTDFQGCFLMVPEGFKAIIPEN